MQAVGAGLVIVAAQQIGFLFLGNGPTRTLLSDLINVATCLLAVICCAAAASRAQGISRIFWLLFCATFALQLAGNASWLYCNYFHIAVLPNSLFPSIFYRLYAGPVAIALFLSQEVRPSRLESLLDGCIVVGLVSLTMYQIQITELSAHDMHLWRVITIGTTVNFILVLFALARFVFASDAPMRALFARQSIYLLLYAFIALLASIGDAFFPRYDGPVDLLWPVTYLAGAIVAVTWNPATEVGARCRQPVTRRTSLLAFNMVLAAMVLLSAILGLNFFNSARTVGLVAGVSVVLFAYAIRSSLMQDNMEKYLGELQESRLQLQRQALHDPLTGLPNRRLFAEKLSQTLALAKRHKNLVALLYIDLDGFKTINDLQGHAIGDLVLQHAAKKMMSRARESDSLARMGGDEFTLLASPVSSLEKAECLARDLLRTLADPFEIDGNTLSVTASIGISVFPLSAAKPDEMLLQADLAMYAVKRGGRNGIRIFSGELQSHGRDPQNFEPAFEKIEPR
jgi:diguanylate cyclase (GGDEF)-like protein